MKYILRAFLGFELMNEKINSFNSFYEYKVVKIVILLRKINL